MVAAWTLLSGCSREVEVRDTLQPNAPVSTQAFLSPGDLFGGQPPPVGEARAWADTVVVGGRTVAVKIVRAPLGSVQVVVGLAKGKVGAVESLAGIAARHGAIAAIIVTFFDAYSDRPARNPYGTLVHRGVLVHVSGHPTVLASWPSGYVVIGQALFRLTGGLDGKSTWPNNWYVYGINDYPESSNLVEIYTRHWVLPRAPENGWCAVVRKGKIVAAGVKAPSIPRQGYVIYLRGEELYLSKRLTVGRRPFLKVHVEESDRPIEWRSATEVIGAGPLLLRDGKIALDPQAEGFSSSKIVSDACPRSAVGVTADGYIVMVATGAVTMRSLAAVMKTLGCRDAMNLDGGGSSGLWFKGKYLVRPGRHVSNGLLLCPR